MSDAKTTFVNSLVDNEKRLAEAIIAGKTAEEITTTLGFDAAQIEKMTKRLDSLDSGEAAAPREEEEKQDAPAAATAEVATESGDSEAATTAEDAPVEPSDAPAESAVPAADESADAKPEGETAAA